VARGARDRLIMAMSSTAIVLSTLAERGQLKTGGGQAAFAVLLFQDIAVIPILAVFPLLGVAEVTAGADAGRPAWMTALLVIGAVGGVVAAGRFVCGRRSSSSPPCGCASRSSPRRC
jgi:Kef-type K+ transport system membrane component KefB